MAQSLKKTQAQKDSWVFYQALVNNDLAKLKSFIARGVGANSKGKYNWSSHLETAVLYHNGDSHFSTLEFLLNKGANANFEFVEVGSKPLHSLARKADVKTIQLLIDFGADVNAKDERGVNPSFHAVHNQSVEVLQLLIDHGSEIDNVGHFGFSTLHEACVNSTYPIVKCLLKSGAETSALNERGRTPLMEMLRYAKTKDFKPKLEVMLKCSNVNVIASNGDNLMYEMQKERFFKNILWHIAKLQALDLPVHPSILDAISSDEEYENYFEQCSQELHLAKNTKLDNSWVTFFNLLVDSKIKLKNYAGNQILVNGFKKSECLEKFPIYGATMKKNMNKGIKWRKMFDRSAGTLSNIFPIFSPTHLIVRDILDCLTLKDYIVLDSKN